jgi:hypothetical protein
MWNRSGRWPGRSKRSRRVPVVTRDVAVAELFAGLAVVGQVGDRLQGGVDEFGVDAGEGTEVVEDLGQQHSMVGSSQ